MSVEILKYPITGYGERNQAYPHEYTCPVCNESVWFKDALWENMQHLGYGKDVIHKDCTTIYFKSLEEFNEFNETF